VFTRCKACHTVHPVNASLLARGGGKFRCGKCNKTGDALESLFDEWPGAGEQPAAAGELPVLGISIDLEAAEQARMEPDEAALSGDPETGATSKVARLSWITAAIGTLAVSVYLFAEFFEQPLLDQAALQPVLIQLGMREPPVKQPFRDLSQIHLVSRELTSHPDRADMLKLTATIVNRANETQAYPQLEVILLDAAGQPLSSSHFTPSDYLASGSPGDSGMTPQAYVALVLELPDPGTQAVGFELNFL
jgi:predicted Zn finger-like uncharacterized protein